MYGFEGAPEPRDRLPLLRLWARYFSQGRHSRSEKSTERLPVMVHELQNMCPHQRLQGV